MLEFVTCVKPTRDKASLFGNLQPTVISAVGFFRLLSSTSWEFRQFKSLLKSILIKSNVVLGREIVGFFINNEVEGILNGH